MENLQNVYSGTTGPLNSIVFPKSCNVIPEYNRSLLSVGYKVQNDSATFNIPYV